MSGGDFLAVTSPQFESAVVRIGRVDRYGTRQGGTLTVTAPGASDERRYVRGVSLNGRDLPRTWLPWAAVAHGGSLAHRLGTEPSAWGTGPGAEPPSVGGAGRHGPDVV
ncbi:glycoside hydrolase domain-containing protein [Streptomyces sp. LZ34]